MTLISRRGTNSSAASSSQTNVYSFDGKHLGALASLDESEIRIAGRRSEFALPGILVREVADRVVTLHVDNAAVARYRRDAVPAPHAAARIANAAVTLVMGLLVLVLR